MKKIQDKKQNIRIMKATTMHIHIFVHNNKFD